MAGPKPSLPKPSARHIAAKRAVAAGTEYKPPAGPLDPPDMSEQCGGPACPPCGLACIPLQMFKWTLTVLLTPVIVIGLVFTFPLLFWMSLGVDAAKIKKASSPVPGTVLFFLFLPTLLLQYAVSKLIGWKIVPFTWYAPTDDFAIKLDAGFTGFMSSFTDPFTGAPVGETPPPSDGYAEPGDDSHDIESVAKKLELQTHCGSTSCPQFSSMCCFTQYLKWMLVILFTPLIAISFVFTLPFSLILMGLRAAKPDGHDSQAAAIFGVVCFWLLCPLLFLELGIFAMIGQKWSPLAMFMSEGTEQFDYADWLHGIDYFVNPLTKERITVPCFGKGGQKEDAQPLV
jgi:hypothetical protein